MGKESSSFDSGDYSVVIIEYFSSQHLIECLESVESQTFKPKEVVVVINGIEESFFNKAKENFERVHFIDPAANLGYSKAANLGIANTSTPFVFVLNPDTQLNKDVGELCSEYLNNHEDVGSLGPRILESNGNIYPSARSEPSVFIGFGHAMLSPFFPNNLFTKKYQDADAYGDEVREADWLSGAGLFLRKSALDEVGGWDEDFFMYCEDIDLGRRLRKKGWKNIYFPLAQITHVQGVSTSRTPTKLLWQHHKSLFTYARKKYENNYLLILPTAVLIAIRFPIALIASRFRIN